MVVATSTPGSSRSTKILAAPVFWGIRAAVTLWCLGSPLGAQVTPAPGWCSMAHCNPQMSDFVQQTPPGTDGNVYVKSSDLWNTGVATGDGCISNGKYAACAYKQSWNALVVYDGDGNTVWGSRDLLDNEEFAGLPIMQADGTVVAADDQHIYKFNTDGSVAWSYPTPGGIPIGLVPTPNGAIMVGTAARTLDQCWQNNCTLSFTVNNGGKGYTSATVILAGGYCPGAVATATISGGAVVNVAATSQGPNCIMAPDVIVLGDGVGAYATGVLNAAAPLSIYNGFTGALVGSTFLYQSGNSGPYYQTANTSCVNNGSYPNRVYMLAALSSDQSQAALWALDIDPTNLASPATPAWSVYFHGPSGASPLCVGDRIYFDGAGISPGGPTQTTVFGVQDNGTSGSFIFQVGLAPGSKNITCNFALDPRPQGGFWHEVKNDPTIYHRDFNTGALMEKINVSSLLVANGAPSATYWQAGIFTTYGTPNKPYLMLPESTNTGAPGYFVMLDLAAKKIAWSIPLAGNDPDPFDTPGGDAVLLKDSNQNPVMVMAGKQTGAYFITEGGPILAPSLYSLSFGTQMSGSSSAPQSFTLINSASALATIGGIHATGAFSQTNTCGATLASGASCTVTVTFSPTTTGPQSGFVTVNSNSQNSPLAVALAGFGTFSTPVAVLSAYNLNFPSQPFGSTSQPQTVTLTNGGTASLSIAGIVAGGATAQTNNCPTNLAPGGSCAINVMLVAPAPGGSCNGEVTLTSNAPGGPQTINAIAACTAPPGVESSLSTTSLVFAPQTTGTASPPQTVKLLNIGKQVLNIASITPSGDVTDGSNCGATLAVGAQCSITVSFTPTAMGPRMGTITVVDSSPDSPHVVTASGVGLANPVPVVNQPLLPVSVQPGTPGLTLIVSGTGFVNGSVVYWNGTPRVTTYIGRTQISAALTANDLAVPATGSVSVVNPSPGGGQSNVVWMSVAYPSAAPLFTSTAQPAGAGPAALTAFDFNADGKLDLAIVNTVDNTVSILLGNGDGTFSRTDYPAGPQPVSVAAGDFNHDGIVDLVVANQSANTVSILLGGGGGAFGLQTPYPTGGGPGAVVVADLNGDGNLDVAVANRTDNTVSILFGNGDGTFAANLDYPAGQSPAALVAADFNGDGQLDLAVGNDFTPNGTVTVLLNHGDGSYLPGVAYATGDSQSLVTLDLNGDGKLDLAAVNELAQTLSVYTGNGDGTFKLGPYQSTHLSPNPLALGAADLNADGTLELAIASDATNGFTVLANNNNGVFVQLMQFGTGSGIGAMAVGDFNDDGSSDVALAEPGTNQYFLLTQVPSTTYSSTSLNFGNVPVGGSATQNLTLTNSGSAVLKVTAVYSGRGAFTQTNNCAGSVVAPGNSCTVAVKFSPGTAGAITGTLQIQDNAPGATQTVGLNGVGSMFTVAINLPQNPVVGGNQLTTSTVTLSNPAPAGGWTVKLSSSNPAVASVPATVQVPAGSTVSSPFTIATAQVSSGTPVTLTARVNGAQGTAILTVNPIAVSFTLAATSVFGGLTLSPNTLTLALPAPAGGLILNLSSSNPAIASVPASVTVAEGAIVSSSFAITSTVVASQTSVTLFAGLSGVSGSIANTVLTVTPAVPGSIGLTPATVVGGLSTTANVVTMTALTPAAGVTVTLSSSKPSVAVVPSSVTVAGNSQTSAPFTITAGYVSTTTQVTITASYLGVNATANLTVTPDGAASVNLSSSSVVGGTGVVKQNTVTLLSPAPSAGATVKLSSSNPSVASVPSSVAVSAGAINSATFQITTNSVAVSTPVTIKATYNGIAAPAILTVNPPAPTMVTLSQGGVYAGKTVNGTVTISAPAPTGGLTLILSSSLPAVAAVPATVTVPAGATVSPVFNITTSPVTAQAVVQISGTYLGNTTSASLTVAP